MSSKLQELLLRWEEQRRIGKPVSVTEVCRDCPELRDELLAQIAALEKMDQMLDLSEKGQPSTKAERRRTRYDDLRSDWEPIADYRLVKRLGKGGFGEVWKAIGPGGFAVALKFVSLANQLGTSERRSLDVIKTFRHPNLLTVFGSWQAHGFLVIGMEMADKTLLDRLNEAIANGEKGIPHHELLNYMEEAAKGIDYLNQPNANLGESAKEAIQHRDIKPQNIFLMGGGVKIGDFGLLRILTKTMTGHTGSLTVSYAAPEFFMGQTARSSDQYSLAVTYCHLRGDRLPFAGNGAQIMQGHLEGSPDLTMLPVGERSIVSRALAKKPEDRWPTCAEFVKALIMSDATSSLPANPSGRKTGSKGQMQPESSAKSFTPHRVLLVVLLLLILMIGGVLWWGIWKAAPEPENPNSNVPSLTVTTTITGTTIIDETTTTGTTTPPSTITHKPKTTSTDLDNLNGTWVAVSSKKNGKVEESWYQQLQIDGDKMFFSQSKIKKNNSAWTVVFDPTKNPKTMDRTATFNTKVVHGIYMVDSDLLIIAETPSVAIPRPTDFRSIKGSNITVYVWRRK